MDGDLAESFRLFEYARKIEAPGLPMGDRLGLVEIFGHSDEIVELPHSHFGHELAHFLSDEEEVVDDVLRLALKALAQHRVLGGNTDRAGVEMTLAHHDAARGDEGGGGKG